MEIKSTNRDNFKLIYENNYELLMSVIIHIVYNQDIAEDLTQEAFERFYLKNMTFPSEEDARFWLLRVAKNLALNSIRHNKREIQMVDKVKSSSLSYTSDSSNKVIEEETKREVRDAIESLPENLRLVIQLKEYSHLDYRTIGKVLGISETNVKVRVYRARKRLEEILIKEDSDVY